jgi:hydroxyacylglutathione hydrolase
MIMALVFERIQTEGIAVLSYLVGDDAAGVAAVIDPTADVERFVNLAREKEVSITHIFETHIHADLVSGARELCARVQSAKMYLSHEGGARYGFDHEELHDGDAFTFGKTVITVKHTPGHTPEHVSFLLAEKAHPDSPWGVLTGDSLFVNSAGRPDLLGSSETEKLTRMLFSTLREFYLTLPDSVIIYPAHGHGSPCGADIGDRMESTIGHERKFNPYLQLSDYEAFKEYTMNNAPPVPTYYPRMKKINAKGPEILGNLPQVRALAAEPFRDAVGSRAGVLLDTRQMLAFGGGHIPGALNMGPAPMLSIWAGWLLQPDDPILLVLADDGEVDQVVKWLLRTGYNNFAGYLVGGMKAWDNAGFPLADVGQITVHELHAHTGTMQVVDVRTPDEWQGGHVPGATHIFLPELRKNAVQLDATRPTAVYCDSGYRASIGTSILKQQGFARVFNAVGSWKAWTSAGLPISKESAA